MPANAVRNAVEAKKPKKAAAELKVKHLVVEIRVLVVVELTNAHVVLVAKVVKGVIAKRKIKSANVVSNALVKKLENPVVVIPRKKDVVGLKSVLAVLAAKVVKGVIVRHKTKSASVVSNALETQTSLAVKLSINV